MHLVFVFTVKHNLISDVTVFHFIHFSIHTVNSIIAWKFQRLMQHICVLLFSTAALVNYSFVSTSYQHQPVKTAVTRLQQVSRSFQ
jgi:hypothetical protein